MFPNGKPCYTLHIVAYAAKHTGHVDCSLIVVHVCELVMMMVRLLIKCSLDRMAVLPQPCSNVAAVLQPCGGRNKQQSRCSTVATSRQQCNSSGSGNDVGIVETLR